MAKKGHKPSTICLNMIVKNEAHIIRRCLESVLPVIDTWVISDTGSTDGTQELIREIMKDVPGELIERPWKNFGHNRQEVLEHAAGKADYILTIDADEWLEFEDGFTFQNLTQDAYYIDKVQPGQRYAVCNIIKNDIGWYWYGVIHEYLEKDTDFSPCTIEGAHIMVRQEGARSLDPDTYRKDAHLLSEALKEEPNNTRYQFYLAQSWRDAEEPALAIEHYEKRIAMGGWDEEVFISKYRIARIMEHRGDDWSECLVKYLAAYEHTPLRAEPIYYVGLHYQVEENWEMAWLFLSRAAQMDVPEDSILFIDHSIYQYRAPLEAGVAAYYLRMFEKSAELNQRVIDCPDAPARIIELAQYNLQLCMDELQKKQSNAA